MSRHGGPGGPRSVKDGSAPDSTDTAHMANYFITYSYLYHQKDMLEDHKRTGAYYNACLQNRAQFSGKTVLDVGTGSGILAIFAAKAGARKVYAVEATSMAQHARRLVEAQGLSDVVEVIQGTIETVQIPEPVDIIISEWMGYFLLRESMLDSVIVARDRFLAPGGALYPSHARMFLAPIRSQLAKQRAADCAGSIEGWKEFAQDMKQYYDVDMTVLNKTYEDEQRDYFSRTAAWADVHPSQLLGPPVLLKSYDLLTVTLEELKQDLHASFSMRIPQESSIEAFCGYFDVQFRGSPANPADSPVVLSTAPDATGATHWGQQVFFLHPPVVCTGPDVLTGTLDMARRADNHRLMDVKITFEHKGEGNGTDLLKRECLFHIE